MALMHGFGARYSFGSLVAFASSETEQEARADGGAEMDLLNEWKRWKICDIEVNFCSSGALRCTHAAAGNFLKIDCKANDYNVV